MTVLHMSSLFPRSTPELFSGFDIPGNLSRESARALAREAFESREEHGAFARLARKYNVSRYCVQQCLEAIEQQFENLFSLGPRLPAVTITLDRRAIERAVVAARAEVPLSIRNLRRLTGIFLGFVMGYTTLWNTLEHAQTEAKAWLGKLNLAKVKTIALDELFFAGRWVLVVIDIRTQLLCGVEVADDRREATWTELLTRLRDQQGLDPTLIVSDAGASILSSAKIVFPSAEQQRDIFHAKRELGQLLDRLEKRAYAALSHSYKAEDDWLEASSSARSLAQKYRYAREDADRRIALYDQVFGWAKRRFDALEFVDPQTGSYQDGQKAETILAEVAQLLYIQKDKGIRKVGTYFKRQKGALCTYHQRLAQTVHALAYTIDEQSVVLTIACLDRLDHQLKSPMYLKERNELLALRVRLVEDLYSLSIPPERFTELIVRTVDAIRKSGRASSLVECFNSVFRKYLRIHKHVSIGPLMLVAVRWNLKTRELGELRNSSPYTALTGIRLEDWLSELGLAANPLPGPQRGYLPARSIRAPGQTRPAKEPAPSMAA
jgi:hypothetical protein